MANRFIEYRHLVAALLALLATLAALGAVDAQAQMPNQGLPIPDSPKQDLTAIDRMFKPPPPAPLALFPQMREQMKDAPAFVRDATFSINPRTYYRNQVTNAPTGVGIQEAWAGGGHDAIDKGVERHLRQSTEAGSPLLRHVARRRFGDQ